MTTTSRIDAGPLQPGAVTAAFELERFTWADGEFEVAGRWRADEPRRFRRVRLLVEGEGRVRRLSPAAAGALTATPDGEPWEARFSWPAGEPPVTRAELEVGRDLVVALPAPGGRDGMDLARERSVLQREREQLERERAQLQAERGRLAGRPRVAPSTADPMAVRVAAAALSLPILACVLVLADSL